MRNMGEGKKKWGRKRKMIEFKKNNRKEEEWVNNKRKDLTEVRPASSRASTKKPASEAFEGTV